MFDINEWTLSVENSVGRTAPIEFSEVKPSAYQIQWGIYKSNYVDTDEDKNGNPTFFQARANIARQNLEASQFDIKKFIDLDDTMDDLKAAVNNIKAAEGKKAKAEALVNSVAKILVNIYSGNMSSDNKDYCNPAWSAQKLVLSKDIEGVTIKKYADDFDLSVSAVAPLSYNTFWKIEEAADQYVDTDLLERAIYKVAEAIKAQLPEIELGTAKVKVPTIEAGENPYILVGDDASTTTDLGTWKKVEIEEAVFDVIKDALENSEIDLSEAIQGLDGNILGNAVDGIADRFASFIVNAGNKLVSALQDHAFTRVLAPIVLYNSADGIKKLAYGTTVNAGIMQINVTSLTEELLVPSYAKYIALFKDGQAVQANVYAGDTQRIDLNLTQAGEYTLVVSSIDYYGYVCNKKYLINVN